MQDKIYAGIDAGGTTFKCVLGIGPEHLMAVREVPVGAPRQTLDECAEFFQQSQARHGKASSLGLACFGPVDLHPSSPGFGQIKSTPKPQWSGVDVVGFFQSALSMPVAFDTDVNGALLGELTWGAAKGLQNIVYVTVGTGVGAGVMMNGRLIYGACHTEAGHMLLPRHEDDSFHGVCPFHGDCLEGLASGTAMKERWQCAPEKLEKHHPAWDLQAHYLASACVNLTMMYSPDRIILGGGVMQAPSLISKLRQSYLSQANAYPEDVSSGIEQFIALPGLAARAGLLGSLALARRALD